MLIVIYASDFSDRKWEKKPTKNYFRAKGEKSQQKKFEAKGETGQQKYISVQRGKQADKKVLPKAVPRATADSVRQLKIHSLPLF